MTLVLEFGSAAALVQAVPHLRRAGHRPVEAYSPCAVEGLAEALGHRPAPVRPVMLLAGLAGGALAFGMQAWSAVYDLPLDSGGRPLFSWPAFLPVTFELAVLCAAIAGFAALLTACGLPRLHHPLFDLPVMARVSADRFLLAFERQPGAAGADLQDLVRACDAVALHEVTP